MADEWSIGGPDRRSSTDVDHAVGIAGNHVWRLLARAYRDDGAVLVGKSRDGTIGSGPEQDDVAARQLEETMDVRGVFRAFRAFPRHAPVQAELTAPPDGAHGPYIGHRYALSRCCPPSRVMNSRRFIRSPRRQARVVCRRFEDRASSRS